MISQNLLEMQKKQGVLNKRLLGEKEPWGPDSHLPPSHTKPGGWAQSHRHQVYAMEIMLPYLPSWQWAVGYRIAGRYHLEAIQVSYWETVSFELRQIILQLAASMLSPFLRVRQPSLSYTIRLEENSESRQGDLILSIPPFCVLWVAPPASLFKTHSIVLSPLSFLLANHPSRKELINPCSY